MGSYDAEIRVSTKVDTSQMQRLQLQIDKAVGKVDALTKKYDELKNKKISTEEYSILEGKISRAKQELESFTEIQKQLAERGIGKGIDRDIAKVYGNIQILKKELSQAVDSRDQDTYLALEDKLNRHKAALEQMLAQSKHSLSDIVSFDLNEKEMEDAKTKVEAIQNEMQKLVDTGKAFTIGSNKEEIAEAANELSRAKSELRMLVTKQDELERKSYKASDGLKKISSAVKKVFGTITAYTNKFFGGFQKNVRKTSSSLGVFSSRLKGIALSLLVFNWITKGFNSMVAGMKEGFKNLIQYSDDYNKSISALKSANTQLKNSFATAFAPIIQLVIPYIVQLINYVTAAANAIAQFVAVLTGKSTWIKAIAVQEDYAASLDGTASSAKKAAGALAKFDDLDVLNKNDSGNGGGAGGIKPGDMFEEVPVGGITGFWKKLLDALNAGDWYEIGALLGEKLKEALDNIPWDEIKEKAREIGTNLAEFINGFIEVEGLGFSIGRTLAEALNTALEFLNSFAKELHWDSVGKFIADGINGFFLSFDFKLAAETINNLGLGILEAFITAVDNIEWYKIGSKIHDFLITINWPVWLQELGDAIAGALWAAVELALGIIFGNDSELGKKVEKLLSDIEVDTATILIGAFAWKCGGKALTKTVLSESFKAAIGGTFAIFLKDLVVNISGFLINMNPGMIGELGIKIGDLLTGSFLDPREWEGWIGEVANEVDRIVNEAIEWVGENVITKGFERLAEFIVTTFDISNSMAWFDAAYEDFKKGGFHIIEGVIEGFVGAIALIPETIVNFFNACWKEICNIFGIHSPAAEMKPLGEFILLGIIEGFTSKISEFTAAIQLWWEESIMPWFTAEKWYELIIGVIEGFTLLWEEVCNWWNESALVTWWEEYIMPWFTAERWMELAHGIVTGITNKWNELVAWWGTNISAWWTNYVAPWFTVERWKTLGEQMKNGIFSGFKGLVNKVVDILNDVIASLENMLNMAIAGINSLLEKVSASPLGDMMGLDFSIGSVSFGRIPHLADGAVIRGGNPFMAILGDQRAGQTNIEAPQSAIMEAVEEGMSRAGGYRTGSVEININYDGETFARLAIRDFLSELDRQGYDIDMLGGLT